nr:hypothetical protein [uncultured Mediterranean phage uvMED]
MGGEISALVQSTINNNGETTMNVRQMTSPRSHNAVANQFIINDDNGNKYFQSYRSLIVKKCADGRIFLDENTWDYSRTTGKYRNEFLGEGTAETRKKIKSGEYILTDLNSKAVA